MPKDPERVIHRSVRFKPGVGRPHRSDIIDGKEPPMAKGKDKKKEKKGKKKEKGKDEK
jgi:hypothetical protein